VKARDVIADLIEQDALRLSIREEPEGRFTVLAKVSGREVGRASGFVRNRACEVLGIEVKPTRRRRGIGSALLRRIAEWARHQDARTIGAAFITAQGKRLFNRTFGRPIRLARIEDWESCGGFQPVEADYRL
jgi:GNAT superfamily N-acetyltransferase